MPDRTENASLVNILIVDDREENLISLESIIEGPGRNIVWARSGNEGLKKNLEYDFDLILSDVQMPEMDGFEMLEILRTNPSKRNIPFIFITAISKEEQYINRGYNEGAVDYLFKPLNVGITSSKVDVFVELAKQKKSIEARNAELKKLYEQKNQFMGMLAHDLRNPISVFQHYTNFLLEDQKHPLQEEQLKLIKAMNESGRYMLSLVNDVLEMAHLESGKMTINAKPIDLKAFVGEILEINRLFAKDKQIAIVAPNLHKLPVALLDESKIRQVLNNLLSNAIKFSYPNTTITVDIDINDRNIYFNIIDQGQGIPPAEQKHLFRAFKQTSVKSTAGEKSTGLGLLICARIIEAHGGEVHLSSEVGKGSVFSFYIPYVDAALQGAINRELEENTEPKTIIVADDSDANRMILKRLLEKLGHKVLQATNGHEVLAILSDSLVDVVFMDVEMPEMNGLDATRAILAGNLIKVPVIVGCTGHSDDEEVQKCMESGMSRLLSKPVNRDELVKVLSLI